MASSAASATDDGDFIINEAPPLWHTALLVGGALAVAGMLLWFLTRKGAR